jgi:hypothetical protein
MATRSKILRRIGAAVLGASIVATILGESSTFYEFVRRQLAEAPKPPISLPAQAVANESKRDKDISLRVRFDERYPLLPLMNSAEVFSEDELTTAIDWTKHPSKRRNVHPSNYAYAIDFVVQGDGEENGKVHTIWIKCSEKPSSRRVAQLCASSAQYRTQHHLVRKW